MVLHTNKGTKQHKNTVPTPYVPQLLVPWWIRARSDWPSNQQLVYLSFYYISSVVDYPNLRCDEPWSYDCEKDNIILIFFIRAYLICSYVWTIDLSNEWPLEIKSVHNHTLVFVSLGIRYYLHNHMNKSFNMRKHAVNRIHTYIHSKGRV